MKYLKQNYKRMIKPVVFLVIIGFLVYVLPILIGNVEDKLNSSGMPYSGASNVAVLAIYLIGVAIFIPIYEFSVLKTKRGADLYYSLPINKKTLYTTLYVKGLIELTTAYVLVFILGIATTFIKGYPFNYVYYLPLFFGLLVGLILYYSFNVSVFLRSNSTIDGALFVVGYTFIPAMFYLSIISMVAAFNPQIPYLKIDGYRGFNSPTLLLYHIGMYLASFVERATSYQPGSHHIMSGIWAGISVAAILLTLFNTKYDKPEDIQQISRSWFGYKTLIPIAQFSFIVGISFFDIPTLLVYAFIITAVSYVGYVIYERKFIISLYSFITLLSVGVISTIISILESL